MRAAEKQARRVAVLHSAGDEYVKVHADEVDVTALYALEVRRRIESTRDFLAVVDRLAEEALALRNYEGYRMHTDIFRGHTKLLMDALEEMAELML